VKAETEHWYGGKLHTLLLSNANGFNNVSIVYVSEIQSNNGSQIDNFHMGWTTNLIKETVPIKAKNVFGFER